MEVKTVEQFAIWVGMQFPVLAVSFLVVRWFLKRADAAHDRRIGDNEAHHERLIREKDARLADRDRQIAKLEAEVAELKGKLSRSPKKNEGGE